MYPALRRLLAQKTSVAHGFLVIYVGNDIEYGVYPPKTRGVDEYGYLRDASPGWWTDIRSFALRNSRFAFYLQNAWRRLRSMALKSSLAVPIDTPYRWIYDEAAFTRDRLSEHQHVLASLRDDARVRGIPVTVVLMPEKGQIYGSLSDLPNRMLSLTLSHLGMPVVDLLPAMRRVATERPPFWHDIIEGHLSPEGHRLVADILMTQS